MAKQFVCRKCGCKSFRRKQYKIKGKGMADLRRKLSNQCPSSFNREEEKVICRKCKHAQRFKGN